MSITIKQIEQEIDKHEAAAANILKGNAPQVKGYAYSETDNGDDFYFNEDEQLHREDGPAVEFASGDKLWYRNGQYHRTDGPAVEYTNGDKFWYRNGQRHRTDGPAVEFANGSKEWYLNGERYTEDEFNAEIKRRKSEGTL